ncbi:OmpA family protein [Ancylomarina longa]|uniref:OmpA-like domain-containing protein n=1 Tax=Ancylomarina longa TaxID=2487017 RepID=A0A434AFV4_9BACT|nr:OmpA family protein [Ancylomarina longa]RUT73246.1 hypothetical protein DLK05_14300 [Ancylomarina longa]
MNRKQSIYFLFVVIFSFFGHSTSYAQSQLIQKGDRLYDNKEYSLASSYYEKYLSNNENFELKRKLVRCYIATNKDRLAIQLMNKIVTDPKVIPDDYLMYANLLKRENNYEKAKIWFKKYANIHPKNKLVSNLILSCNLINELEDNKFYTTNSLNINSPQSDFASAIYKNGIVFVSGRKNESSKQIDGRTGEYYLDLYYSKKEGNKFLPPVPFDKGLNTKYHEGPACFTKNNKFIYFTRNKGNLNLEGKSELNIYTARFNGENWDKPELFQFSGQNYSIGHPCISSDGRDLYLISNMSGGYGGTDIYVCHKLGFSWSYPINLGPNVNTSGNEMFPFIAEDGYLYFASDGHIGFGGLDIFKTIFQQNQWTYPVNLGPPFNSSKDDFGYLVDKNKELGYFSSNRNNNDDIFEFHENKDMVDHLKGRIVKSTNRESLENVQVSLMDNLSKEKTDSTDTKGFFTFKIFKGKNYSLIINKPGYKTKRILYFASDNNSAPAQLNILMEPTKWMPLKGNIIDQFSARSIENASIDIVNISYNINSFSRSDKYGDFEIRIDPSKSYNIIIQKEGYFTKVLRNYKYKSDKFEQIELQRFNKNQNMELYGSEFKNESADLEKSTINELENLAGLLQVNPHVAIEIIGYTHSDKGRKENRILSMKRAKNAAAFLINKGITPNRIKTRAAGYNSGKSALIVKLIEAF